MRNLNKVIGIDLSQPAKEPIEQSNQQGNFLPILGLLIIILLAAGIIYYFKISSKQQNSASTSQIAPITSNKKTTSNLNPNTGDLYKDIGIRMKEVLK